MGLDRRRGRRCYLCGDCPGLCCDYPWVTVYLTQVEKEAWADGTLPWETVTVNSMGNVYPILAKNKDGSCVYFDRAKGRCSIYKKARPFNCRYWYCGRGMQKEGTTEHSSAWLNMYCWALETGRMHLIEPVS